VRAVKARFVGTANAITELLEVPEERLVEEDPVPDEEAAEEGEEDPAGSVVTQEERKTRPNPSAASKFKDFLMSFSFT
jgi:hypothetical protein